MRSKGLVIGGVLGIVVIVLVALGLSGSSAQTTFTSDETTIYDAGANYSGAPILGFNSTESQQLADQLADVERRNDGVCFGWRLTDGTDGDVELGSSRGPNVPADTCDRWVETRTFVAQDLDLPAADVEVVASSEFSDLPNRQDYTDLGITADALIAEPAAATGQAAMATPLLLVQNGALPAPPAQAGQSGGAPSQALPSGDGSGSSVAIWFWLVVLVLVTIAATALGFRARSRQRDSGPPPPGFPPRGPIPDYPPQGPPPGNPPQGPPQAGPTR